MSDKRYYWLKLQKDFFKRNDIQVVESMPNGKDYVLFYLKLLCEATSEEGRLRFSETIPYSPEMLSTITKTNVDIVRSAIKVFQELGMIDVLDDGTYYMTEVEKMIGSETKWAQYKRDKKQEIGKIPIESKKSPIEIDIEKEKEIEIDKDLDKELDKEKKESKKKKETLSSVIENYTDNEELTQCLKEFVEMRKAGNKGMFTVSALKKNLGKLDKLAVNDGAKIDIVNQTLEHTWKGFYPIQEERNNQINTHRGGMVF